MDWVNGLPPGSDKSFNSCLFIAESFSKIPIFFPCHKYDTSMDKALMILNRVVSCTGILTNIISDRYPKFSSSLWKNFHQIFGTNSSFSKAYHPQTDGLAERMIQTLKDMVRRFCAYTLELKDCGGFTYYWCTLI
ncbi:hypothetical protein O181_002919 [Austropuccinia psidii MF-1]|uniref:Integrase catalytic domain-containing protein n=1 Tax=Austropuccinia psidii MF-1 TaxID=1389203 RepID=A0A9Q3BDC8_9BASI|nr:hypothetical protein [Austropuccinia psidii MF-1]